MEDFYLHEEILMLDAGPIRRNRVRRDHFAEMSDSEFVALTRFSKDGVERLAARLADRLQSPTQRNNPLTPFDQVGYTAIKYNKGDI